MASEVEALLKRFAAAEKEKLSWQSLMEDAYEYALPNRNLFTDYAPGQRKMDRVFDSTAITSTISFANRIQSDLMPPFQRWCKLQAGPMVPQQFRDEVNEQLEWVNDQLYAVLMASNFDTANNECLLDLAIGTGCMLMLEGDFEQPVRYIPVPLAHVVLESGPWGAVSGIYRHFKELHIRNIKQQWRDARLPETLSQRLERDHDAKCNLVESTYHDPDGAQWHYEVLYKGTKDRLLRRTYQTCPWATPRWIKVAGETYGRGPVIQALPDIKTLNKLIELVLKNASLNVAGIYTVADDGTNVNNIRIVPGGFIPVSSNGGSRGPSIQPLARSGAIDLAMIEMDRLVSHIKQVLLDERLPPDGAQPRSATEIIQRVRELAKDIGAPFGRLMSEYVRPIVQRTLEIMANMQLIEPVRVNGLTVQVQVMSPLAQEQNLADVEAVVNWLSVLASFGEEQVAMAARIEEIGPWMGEKMGVPSNLIRSEEERAQLQQMAAQAAQQQIGTGGAQGVGTGGELAQAA